MQQAREGPHVADQKKPLPKPPTSAFGRRKPMPEQNAQDLIADRMAEAAATGGLEDFLSRELPDSEHARSLATMMMGMTGMMPTAAPPKEPHAAKTESAGPAPDAAVSEDVRQAVLSGDVKNVMEVLRREHQKRSGSGEAGPAAQTPEAAEPSAPSEEKVIVDTLIRIAAENQVTVDWVIMRAMKLYLQEFQKTGRL